MLQCGFQSGTFRTQVQSFTAKRTSSISKVKDKLTNTNQSGFFPTISSIDASIKFILNSSNNKINSRTNEESVSPHSAFFLGNLCTENGCYRRLILAEPKQTGRQYLEFKVIFVKILGNDT